MGAEDEPDGAMAAVNGTGAGVVGRSGRGGRCEGALRLERHVFDGTKTTFYLETDQTGRSPAYGILQAGRRGRTLSEPAAVFAVRLVLVFGINGRQLR